MTNLPNFTFGRVLFKNFVSYVLKTLMDNWFTDAHVLTQFATHVSYSGLRPKSLSRCSAQKLSGNVRTIYRPKSNNSRSFATSTPSTKSSS
jgi:hypothetical protein